MLHGYRCSILCCTSDVSQLLESKFVSNIPFIALLERRLGLKSRILYCIFCEAKDARHGVVCCVKCFQLVFLVLCVVVFTTAVFRKDLKNK